MTIIKTQRLQIREATQADAPFFLKLMNAPGWLRFIGDRKIKTVEDAKKYIQNSLIASYREKQFGLYVMEELPGQHPVGISGLLQRDYLPVPDIGFAILPEYEGRGYTSEAGKAVVAEATSRLGIAKVMGITLPDNVGSQRVLEKIGLSFEKKIERDGEILWLYKN